MTLGNRKGINVQRRIVSPGTSGVGAEINDLRNSQPVSTFLRAVVVRVLNDVTSLTEDDITSLREMVSNPGLVDLAPRNSVIVRIVSRGSDRRGSKPVICYPFLPSHLALPIKSGEQVWVIYENPEVGGTLPYWLWRTSEPRHIEDVNYTHADRKFERSASLSTSEEVDAGTSEKVPGFPNGGDSEATRTLTGQDDYDTILEEDPEYDNFTPEPVPRFTKRPGDVVVQGSNNTLIVLGEDRTETTTTRTGTRPGSAAMDFVVGRARFLPAPGAAPTDTAPGVVKNTRGNLETDKNPATTGKKENLAEGNPDIRNDASRVYLAQKSAGDTALGITQDTLPKKFGSERIETADDQAFAIMRSDQIRIVARKDDENNINGSVIILKEGTATDDQSALILGPDGSARIDGKVIYIGRPGGRGPGPGGSEPYIKFSVYKTQLESIIDQVVSVLNNFNTAFLVPIAAPGTPHPGLSTTGVTAIASTVAKLNVVKSGIGDAKSTRIFGE